MDKLIQFFMPDPSLVNYHDRMLVKNGRLFITFIHITIVPLALFTVVNYLTGKTIAGHIDFTALLSFLSWTFLFKWTGQYRRSVIGFVLTCQYVISAQHFVAPIGLGTNLLWAPLIMITSSYLLGRKEGLRLGIVCITLMVMAEAIPYYYPVLKEGFLRPEILQYNISIIIVTGISAFSVTKRIVTEESDFHHKIEEQYENLFEQKEANSAILNIVGHDIANPLAALQARLELIHKSDPQNQQTEKMLAQVDKIKLAIDSVRKYREVESGKLSISLHPVDLSKTVDESYATLESRLKEKQISLVKKYDVSKHYWVQADSVSLQLSVVNNLFTNAIKFSPEDSSIEIDIKEAGEEIIFSVRDFGRGIPLDIIPYIFSPNRPTTKKGTWGEAGSGLGMPIMKMFIDKYDAQVSVSNGQNGGTLFTISFKRSAPASEFSEKVA